MAWTTAGNIRGPQGPQGPTGAQGEPGPAGPASPAGLNWLGAWSADTAYADDDSVSWGGSTYFATAPHAAGSPPPTGTAGDPGDDTALNAGWALLAVQGATGPAGPQGAQGPAGDVGPQGPVGATGGTGPAGSDGARGSLWYTGTGAPGAVAGQLPGDKYLDTASGDVYTLS